MGLAEPSPAPPPPPRLGEGLGEGEQEESKAGEEEPELRRPRLGDLGTFTPTRRHAGLRCVQVVCQSCYEALD